MWDRQHKSSVLIREAKNLTCGQRRQEDRIQKQHFGIRDYTR